MKKVVYSIEGNIGSGKTVLLHLLAKHFPNIAIAEEPVAQWQHASKNNLLQHYYKDISRWAYTFQNYALLTRSNGLHAMLKQPGIGNQFIFSERSIIADKEIFAKMLFRENKMTEMEYSLYLRFYEDLAQLYSIPVVHQHIYLRTDPGCCLKRIAKRGRKEEASIDLNYLNKLHARHEEWLGDSEALVLEGGNEFQTNESELQSLLDQTGRWLTRTNQCCMN